MKQVHRFKSIKIAHQLYVIGKCLKVTEVPGYIIYCFRNRDIDINKFHVFHRLLKDSYSIDSGSYPRARKTKSSTIKYKIDGIEKIGSVKTFVKICDCEKCDCKKCSECEVHRCEYYAIVQNYEVDFNFYCETVDRNLPFLGKLNCKRLEHVAIELQCISEVLFEIELGNNTFIVEMLNNIESE